MERAFLITLPDWPKLMLQYIWSVNNKTTTALSRMQSIVTQSKLVLATVRAEVAWAYFQG